MFGKASIVASGGNACVISVDSPLYHNSLFRLSQAAIGEHAAKIQSIIYREFEWGKINFPPLGELKSLHGYSITANIFEFTIKQWYNFPYREAVEASLECMALVQQWAWLQSIEDINALPIGWTEMERLQGKTMRETERLRDLPTLYAVALELLVFFYRAQLRFGFEHGDLNLANIMIMEDRDARPKIIDFDYASFYPLSIRNDRRLGSLDFWPYEFLDDNLADQNLAERDSKRSVLGGADVWALGIILLSKRLGLSANMVNPQGLLLSPEQRLLTVTAIVALLVNLADLKSFPRYFDIYGEKLEPNEPPNSGWFSWLWPRAVQPLGWREGLPAVYETIKATYGDAINGLSPEEKEFFAQMLHPNPKYRTFGGRLYGIFDFPVFKRFVSSAKRADIYERFQYDSQGSNRYSVETNAFRSAYREDKDFWMKPDGWEQEPKWWLQNLIASGYIASEALRCVHCGQGTGDSLYLCSESGKVVCGNENL
jgi:hypothetical protein